MSATKSLSGHGRKHRAYWQQLRILDCWLFPHQSAEDFFAAQPPSLLSPGWLLPKRFLVKFSVNLVTGCFVWRAGLDRAGYAQFHYDGSSKLGHGFGYRQIIGPVPAGYQLDHRVCELHYCVNWEHLEPVTDHENNLRAFETQVRLGLRPSFQSPLWRPT